MTYDDTGVKVKRRTFVCVLALGILVAPLAAGAQQPGKMARIGVLGDTPGPALEVFRRTLNELGYVEGRNLVLVYRWAEGKLDRLPALADELVRLRVDVILAPSSTFVRAAKQATTNIPIVFAIHNDPVGTGDVASLARPGGNITGVTQMATDITAKQLQLLLEAVPGARRVAVFWNPTTPSHVPSLREIREAAGRLGVVLQLFEARTAGEFDGGYAAATREHAQAVLVLTSPASFAERRRVAELALRHRLPTMHAFREFAEAGGLMSYAPNRADMYRRAAAYVDKILKGAKPADLPVEQPTKFELVINLKTAKALGVTIPQSLLLRADQVIQ